jgi:molybdate transport system ATP-binding protein
MTLSADFTITSRDVALAVEVPRGSTTAVLGPNGAGKSTLLAVLAGLLHPDSGAVRLDGELLSEPGRVVPPHRRGITLLEQQPRLFPRMSVLANVAFPARARGEGRGQARSAARAALDRLHAAELAQRRPSSLSGGQAQRVALARAVTAQPRVLLLDEPLAALDQRSAAGIRGVLQEVLAERTGVLVTHEVLDAALLADQVVVVESGRVVESGPTAQVMTRPRHEFTAQLCGLNVLRGQVTAAGTVITPVGEVSGLGDVTPGTSALAAFTPGSVAVYRADPGGSPRNVFRGRVVSLQPLGGLIRVRTPELMADLTPAAVAALAVRPGDEVVLTVKAAEVRLY